MAADPRLGGLDGGADLFGLGLFIVQLRAPKAVQGPDLGGGQLPAGAGAVRTEEQDGMHVYFPAVSREDAAARQTRNLLGRVYHGSLSLLVSAMTREEALSKAEIDELYAILDEMEAKQGDA